MKKPNLSYNNYFPFYTQNTFGDKKYCYWVETIMHISRERGIRIFLEYELKKPKKISIKRIEDRNRLYNAMDKDTHITYIDFAKEVNTVYRHISGAIKTLMAEPSYRVIFAVLSTYFKFNPDIELKADPWSKEIELIYGKFDYRIAGGKKVDNKEPRVYTDSEEDAIMKRIDPSLRAFNDATTYQEIAGEDFEKRFDDEWDYFVEYFNSPKYIRKNEYRV
ncbi:hypothetical protein [Dysgonomonas termitidis]|uniref:Initiator Rep protein domain-containing protein n=1 Tax=Dysgonomonas termitidis TaxID=1516126 RepID=A0ABV9KUJ8_9BACT